jgi:DNA-binding transcriptional MerR regulator
MLMNEVREKTGLSRKAVEYYEAKGLINPKRDSNNYRIYSDKDISILNKISLYRKLGCSIEEIKNIINDQSNSQLGAIIRNREIKNELENQKTQILKSLLKGENIEGLKEQLDLIDKQETMFSKLSEAFPGYLGQSFFLAYKPFLNEQLMPEHQKYFNNYINFLDNLPDLPISREEAELIEQTANYISLSALKNLNAVKMEAVDNYDKWFENNKEIITKYIEYKQTKAYKNNPIMHIQEKIKKYLEQNGYYDIAIPLIRRFSPKYNEYYKKMLKANDKLIKNVEL